MWSAVTTARSSLKHLARAVRHTPSIRSFGSVTNQVKCFWHRFYYDQIDISSDLRVYEGTDNPALLCYRDWSQKISSPGMRPWNLGFTGEIDCRYVTMCQVFILEANLHVVCSIINVFVCFDNIENDHFMLNGNTKHYIQWFFQCFISNYT